MAKYAKGKKSFGISDIGGHKVPYNQLRTTWDNLRVDSEEWSPKHPQLTPAKNIFDAEALFKPRPDNDPEDVTINLYAFDPFVKIQDRRSIGLSGLGRAGFISGISSDVTSITGVGGTGATGTESLFITTDVTVTGVAGTGGTGAEVPNLDLTGVSGMAGTGAVGIESTEISLNETGVAGTGAVGTETAESLGWGQGTWGQGGWGS
jgi:hypothetical protein